MSRREKRQPEAPQPQEVAIEAPEGLPSYLAFRPEVDTVEMHQAVQHTLQMIDRKLATSNHLQAHTAIKDMILPFMLTFYEWILRAQRDQLRHTDELAAFLAANSESTGGVPAELVLRLTNYFHITTAVLKAAEAAFKKIEPAPAIAAEVQQAVQSLQDLVKATDDLEEEVYEYYNEDDEEEEDEDEDLDDVEGVDEDDVDPDEVGVDEDEPLFDDDEDVDAAKGGVDAGVQP